jgi:PAS domain S-box-containing protein
MTESSDDPRASATDADGRAALGAHLAESSLVPPVGQTDLEGRDDLAIVACLTDASDDDAIFLPALDYCQIPSRIVREPDGLTAQLEDGAGVLLLGDEALTEDVVGRLSEWYAALPFWSALPLIVVTGGETDKLPSVASAVERIGASHHTVLPRPMRPETLLAVIYVAVRSRALQYSLRDRLGLHESPDATLAEALAEELRTIYETAPVGLCLLDREFRYVRLNQRMADMNGFPVAAHIGRRPDELIPDLARTISVDLQRVLDTGEPVLDREVVGETPARPGEDRAWVEQWYPLRDHHGEVIGINVIAQEVTEQRQARAALEKAHAVEKQLNADLETLVARRTAILEQQTTELKRLTLALSRAEHEERKRLSEVLHGGLQQSLLATRIQLQDWAEQHGAAPPPTAMRLLGDALNLTRTLSYELSPPLHPDTSLREEFEWISRWSREHQGLTVELDIGAFETEPPETPRLFLMQSIRELLINVVKHAGVREARVSAREEAGQLVVSVSDRGLGFDVAVLEELESREVGGFGLRTIRGRALAIGGELEASRRRGGGMEVTIRIPANGSD